MASVGPSVAVWWILQWHVWCLWRQISKFRCHTCIKNILRTCPYRPGTYLMFESCKSLQYKSLDRACNILQYCSAALLVQAPENWANSDPTARCCILLHFYCDTGMRLGWADDDPMMSQGCIRLPTLQGLWVFPNGLQVEFRKLTPTPTKTPHKIELKIDTILTPSFTSHYHLINQDLIKLTLMWYWCDIDVSILW